MLYLVELWEELGDKYYLISPINDLALRVSSPEGRQGSRVFPWREGVEGDSGVYSLFDATVVPSLGILVSYEVGDSAFSSVPGHTDFVP